MRILGCKFGLDGSSNEPPRVGHKPAHDLDESLHHELNSLDHFRRFTFREFEVDPDENTLATISQTNSIKPSTSQSNTDPDLEK